MHSPRTFDFQNIDSDLKAPLHSSLFCSLTVPFMQKWNLDPSGIAPGRLNFIKFCMLFPLGTLRNRRKYSASVKLPGETLIFDPFLWGNGDFIEILPSNPNVTSLSSFFLSFLPSLLSFLISSLLLPPALLLLKSVFPSALPKLFGVFGVFGCFCSIL